MPAATMSTPASRVRMMSACSRSAALKLCSAEPAARAAALVVVITMRRVLEVSPPKIGGIDASGYRSAFFERYNKASQVINVGGISGPISSVLTASTLPTHGGIAIGTATPGSG